MSSSLVVDDDEGPLDLLLATLTAAGLPLYPPLNLAGITPTLIGSSEYFNNKLLPLLLLLPFGSALA